MMCLSICVYSDKLDDKIARSIADSFQTEAKLEVEVWPPKKWRKKTPLHLSITEEGGCACSLLTDEAGWDEETWDIRPEIRPRLALIIEQLRNALPDGFTIEAMWEGDEAEHDVALTINELSVIVKNNKIRTRVRYTVA